MSAAIINMLQQNQRMHDSATAKTTVTSPTKVTKESETMDKRVPPGYSCLGEYYELSCDDCPGYCHDAESAPQQMTF